MPPERLFQRHSDLFRAFYGLAAKSASTMLSTSVYHTARHAEGVSLRVYRHDIGLTGLRPSNEK